MKKREKSIIARFAEQYTDVSLPERLQRLRREGIKSEAQFLEIARPSDTGDAIPALRICERCGGNMVYDPVRYKPHHRKCETCGRKA